LGVGRPDPEDGAGDMAQYRMVAAHVLIQLVVVPVD
jgi:hypothetical protein